MADFNVKIDMQGLTESLNNLADQLDQPDTYTDIIGNALEPAERRITDNTPTDTGELRRSVRSEVGPPPRQLANLSEPVADGTVALGVVGWGFEDRAYRLRPRSIAIEFGTIHQPADPVLRPALNAEADQMTATVGEGLMKFIEDNTE